MRDPRGAPVSMSSPRASLVVIYEGQVIDEIAIGGARVTIGRAPENTIRFDDAAVSGRHAAIVLRPEDAPGPLIMDLGSTNGIRVNGTRVQRQRLRHGDYIDLGHHRLRYLEEQALAGVAGGGAQPPRIRVLNGPDVGHEAELTGPAMPLGGPHAGQVVIERRGDGYVVAPARGASPARVNGAPVDESGYALRRGDVVEVAGIRYEFLSV